MRALVLSQSTSHENAGRIALRDDYPMPVPAAGESLVRIRMAGICGTDLEITRGYMGFTGVPGHEFVGEVITTTISGLMGRRVVGEINAACGQCEFCRADLGRHCSKRTVLGILGRDGAFAEYLCLPSQNLIPVPDTVADEVAVFTEPLAAAFEIFEQTSIKPAERIAILGDGRLGVMVALAMKARGLDPVLGGHHQDKLQRIAGFGVATRAGKQSPGGLRRGGRLYRLAGRTGPRAGAGAPARQTHPQDHGGRLRRDQPGPAGNQRNPSYRVAMRPVRARARRSSCRQDRSAAADLRDLPLKDGLAALARAAESSTLKVLITA